MITNQDRELFFSPRGIRTAKTIAKERWFQYMRSSNDSVLKRLGASLIITGVLQKLQPHLFLEEMPTQDGVHHLTIRKRTAIQAYEKRQAELMQQKEICQL